MHRYTRCLRTIAISLALPLAATFLSACGGAISGLSLTGVTGVTVTPQQLYLAWVPHPDPTVSGYLVYFGPTPDSATQVISDLSVASNGFNPQAPYAIYHISDDLRMQAGDTACFKLAAYNQDGISDATPGVCTTI
jgi:hypothetical protein